MDLTNYALTTDLYQLTMAQGYLKAGMASSRATFDLFVRHLPKDWKYLLVCGVEEALAYLENLRFSSDDIAFLRSKGFSDEFCSYLRDFRFRGDVRGLPEGTPVFPHEPILEVTGNLIEAQLVETTLLTLINFPTLVCSKASRIVEAARPATIVDFGLRRAPGPEASLRVARAAYIAGATGTSNVEAARRFDIPVVGTMAHAFVMACTSELAAFRAWCKAYPEGTTLLIDTYDIVQGAHDACKVASEGAKLNAVRIDSGDFADNTFRVRHILDSAGLNHVKIIVSGDMNEDKIDALKKAHTYTTFCTAHPHVHKAAPIDGFGVGTDMATARPIAALGGVYKLVEVDGRPVVKAAKDKATWPCRKQIWRFPDHDVLSTLDENCAGDPRPLLKTLVSEGKRTVHAAALPDVQRYCTQEVAKLRIEDEEYKVAISGELRRQRDLALKAVGYL